MKKKIIEGYFFISSGCEHGPSIMKWTDKKWSKKDYEILKKASWCDNFYTLEYMHDGKEYIIFDSTLSRKKPWATTVKYNFIPGKKYRITIEEI